MKYLTITLEKSVFNEIVIKKTRKKTGSWGSYTVLRLELSWLNTFPMIGPRIMRAAITTMAISTRIKAYSTRPWPRSLRENSTPLTSFLLRIDSPHLSFL
jgi:hypothetical protein